MVQTIKIQKYPAYKPSGVEWLGEIPEHWELTRLGTKFEERKTKVSDKDYAPLSVTKNGTIPQLDSAAKSNDGDNRKLVKNGDFVINSRSDRKGSSGISDRDGSVSLIYIVLEPKDIQPIYCNYLLKSYNFIEEYYRMGHGIVADLWTTRYDEMKSIMVGIPSLTEQTAIASFLDRKTALLDQAIGIKEKQIELLKERRQILIHRAVTRGVGSLSGEESLSGVETTSVKLKESGVEWIGEIPEHWKLSKLGNYIEILSGYAFPSVGFSAESGIKLLRGINVSIGKIKWDDVVYWPNNKVQNLDSYFLKENDIVFGMDRPLIAEGIRIAEISNEDLPCLLLQRVSRIRAIKELSQEYLILILRSKSFTDYFLPILSGVSVPHLSPNQIQSFKIGIPDLETQKSIITYVEAQSNKISSAISLKEQEIEKLKEYKASLINEVVTGKIKV
ncbi:MAG: restriction endonuclease subunit S [Mariniphaga sp.]